MWFLVDEATGNFKKEKKRKKPPQRIKLNAHSKKKVNYITSELLLSLLFLQTFF